MPRTEFSRFYGQSKPAHSSNSEDHDQHRSVFEDDGIEFQDLSSFNRDVSEEVEFRLKILTKISTECESINPKTIEPLRVKLQMTEIRKIPSACTIYRWWLTFKKSGFDVCSLAPNYKKRGNREAKVADIVSIFMDKAIEQAISAKQINATTAFRRVRRKVRQYNLTHQTRHKYPTYEAIRKRIKKITPFEKLAAKKGVRVAKREFRNMGKKIRTETILERVEIDHTWLDLFAVHPENRTPLGRPYLTQLVDCYSKAVIGFYLGFEPPSYVSVALALKNAIKPKTKLVNKYPLVKGEWLCSGIPDLLVTDNGKEFQSADFISACNSLYINIHQCKVEQPDEKPYVERQHGTTNTSLLDDLPGKAFCSYLKREGYNSLDEATLTIEEITEIYLVWLVDIFLSRSNARGTNCPNNVWKRAFKDCAPNEFKGTDEELDFCFAKQTTRMLRKSGVNLAIDLNYSSERLAEYRGKNGNQKITIKYNPENMGFIWVLDEDSESYFKVPAIDYKYASSVSYWMHKKNLEITKGLNASDHNVDAEVDAELRIEEIVEKAIENKKTTITQKKRAARYEENKRRALEVQPPKELVFPEQSPSSTGLDEDDDSYKWDIDYI